MNAVQPVTFGNLSRVRGLVHAVSTRAGGVSAPPMDSLNLGFHVGDAPQNVVENRRRFASAAGFALEDVVTTRQVHGTLVRTVGASERGVGALEPVGESWACDGLVTREPEIVLMGFSADCPLVLLADEQARVAGLVHAGWRSAFGGIVANAVDAMVALGAEPGRIIAAISPSAGGCCYEVGGELRDALRPRLANAEEFFRPRQEKFLLDLPGVVRRMLVLGGVREENVEVSQACTICEPSRFFSHRASGGKTGRLAGIIGWNR
jgi:polyphenol oxidase